ncbi:hypothetical protein GORHZ_150_00065 [Gordonia rhizosphera NBRC 16068]|uniref:Uncharacterized protein n=1 Tax=Gordonia rhizosphera NBRC 16068 TaxID=1108045 RepID=K6WZ55_9ACTN|nr:hypothetical protein GORHZ_150_00065 [Gordonia rhizosphera NBRC 16068]
MAIDQAIDRRNRVSLESGCTVFGTAILIGARVYAAALVRLARSAGWRNRLSDLRSPPGGVAPAKDEMGARPELRGDLGGVEDYADADELRPSSGRQARSYSSKWWRMEASSPGICAVRRFEHDLHCGSRQLARLNDASRVRRDWPQHGTLRLESIPAGLITTRPTTHGDGAKVPRPREV